MEAFFGKQTLEILINDKLMASFNVKKIQQIKQSI